MGRDWWSPYHLCKKGSIYHSSPIISYCKASKKIFQGSVLIDFPLQNNIPPRVYGYISITLEKKIRKPCSLWRKQPLRKIPARTLLFPHHQCCQEVTAFVSFSEGESSGECCVSANHFLFLFQTRVAATCFLTFYEKLNRDCSFQNLQLTWTKFLQAAHMIKIY